MSKAKKILVVLGAIIMLGGGVMAWKMGPRNIIGMLRYDQRQEGRLVVGDMAPDVELLSVDGKRREKLAGYFHDKPLVLIFGSFT